LLLALTAVVLLAKSLSAPIEQAVFAIGAPQSLVGVVIACMVLMPEGFAAIRAARRNLFQTSLNLALGSALASIGLTIPAIAVYAIWLHQPLMLGIDLKSTLLLSLTLFITSMLFATGRTNVQQGLVLLVIFAVYLFTSVVP
jgi:Ca2+:H+ antiporter